MESLIKAVGLKYNYNQGLEDQTTAVDGIDFEIFKNDFVALCGKNGSGKSTIAKLINGLLVPTGGEISVFGINTRQTKQLFDIRRRCGVVFQNPDNQTVASIIEDDVAFGPENIGLAAEEINQRVDFALKAVGMEEYRKGASFRLSGGQKQRVAIAGVLALKPEILILDEATSMLDPRGRAEIMKIVKSLHKQEGVTVVMITHFMEEAAEADRIIVLNDGKIILDGGKEVLTQENELVSAGLTAPLGVRLANKLREKGLKLDQGIVGSEALVEALCPSK